MVTVDSTASPASSRNAQVKDGGAGGKYATGCGENPPGSSNRAEST